jgi:hypothetical protein
MNFGFLGYRIKNKCPSLQVTTAMEGRGRSGLVGEEGKEL